ncbi:TPA: hypothetical protein TZE14_000535 [Streptococcus suis]|uniref:hypothetical protein n=1 Tax=Streptococcus TaxID=1301 RepID=UPI0005CF44DA|nr:MULTISPECIES: hypothetical protein [Streptococcus]NQI09711.1 hypothetical protein [Streptococcus suis]NQR88409.1 hypothetical protein [Streptococcus suis]QWV86594.1 hypothetical protein KQ224_00145 [Streptococcus parasuis]CYU08012.1 Uncharacterised protein [Streptococcus suis]HEL2165663.1 hypothetical protein [Streptococcus suis]
MTTLTSYYTQDDSDAELRELIRSLQKRAAHVQASLIRGDYKKVKKQFKADGKDIVLNTQTALNTINFQIDTAIRGQAGTALQQTVEETLPKYEDVF